MGGEGEKQLRVAVNGNYGKVLYVAYKIDINKKQSSSLTPS
ncbi:hypothetical protein BN2127_JRS10_00664 [Bacillus subtilis]|nr:hypothetical protein BN2127_JRS10_00664 [Bacillus subtilis]